jgi:adenylate kinase family enzyme
VILPKAAQVVDPFHVISLANRALDTVRRLVQHEQTGHRGRRDDPLYRARRFLGGGVQTQPLIEYYEQRERLIAVNGSRPLDEVTWSLRVQLQKVQRELGGREHGTVTIPL